MVKQQYRSEIGIIGDILGAIAEHGKGGAAISAVSKAANVSYNSLNEKCQKLVDANLVKSIRDDVGCTFFITEKGVTFLEQLLKFTNTMKSMNIRY